MFKSLSHDHSSPTRPLVVALSFLCALAPDSDAESPPQVQAGEGGFLFGSSDGAYTLRLRGQLQVDARAILDDAETPDPLLLRSARPFLEVTLFRWLEGRVMPDFGGGRVTLQDAWLRLRPWPWLQLTAGKLKVPFGLERLQAESATYLAERGLPTALAPNRDVGFLLSSELFGGALTLELGVFNGQADNSVTDLDAGLGKDVSVRVSAFPFRPLGVPALDGLGFGVAVTYGQESEDGGETSKYATPGAQTFFRARTPSDDGASDGVVPDGERLRVTGQAQLNVAWFGFIGEVVWTRQSLARDEQRIQAEHLAWQVVVDFALFGGASRFDGVRPDEPVSAGGLGAFTLAARYGELRLDGALFPVFADPARAAQTARNAGVAVSWWATRNLRALVDFNRTDFDGGAADGDRAAENVLTTRLQLAF